MMPHGFHNLMTVVFCLARVGFAEVRSYDACYQGAVCEANEQTPGGVAMLQKEKIAARPKGKVTEEAGRPRWGKSMPHRKTRKVLPAHKSSQAAADGEQLE